MAANNDMSGSGRMEKMTERTSDVNMNFLPDVGMNRGFDLALRGYERRQVEDYLANLEAEIATLRHGRDVAADRVAMLEQRLEELHVELQTAQRQVAEFEPSYAGLGARVENILRLAEEEAIALRADASATGDRIRAGAEDDAKRSRGEADREAQDIVTAAEREAGQRRAAALAEAEGARADAAKDAAAVRAEASSELEEARAKAAQAARDFETTLARRREQAEQELSARLAAAEQRLTDTSDTADQIKREAEAHRAEADRRAGQILDSARRESEAMISEATAKAARARSEVERELSNLVRRRDSVQAQLQNVREMLATMTGASANSAGDEVPAEAEQQ
jgi:cell division septum initiation protein DivIVA